MLACRQKKIASKFPDLAGKQAVIIVELAVKHQHHGCSDKRERPEKDVCWYGFPREPSGITLIKAPHPRTLPKEVDLEMVKQSFAVKEAVKGIIKTTDSDEMQTTSHLYSSNRSSRSSGEWYQCPMDRRSIPTNS